MRFICKHTMNEHSLPKSEKLCSRTAINRLFAEGSAFIVYPLRIVYRISPSAISNAPSNGSTCAVAFAKPTACTRRY